MLIELLNVPIAITPIYIYFLFSTFQLQLNAPNEEITSCADWIILAVPNIIQRSSHRRSVLLISLLFISCSNNKEIHKLLLIISSNLSKNVENPTDDDWKIFKIAALEFFKHEVYFSKIWVKIKKKVIQNIWKISPVLIYQNFCLVVEIHHYVTRIESDQ